ncbi:MAG: hypothetical protein HY327_05570 [Chloroflexi bacterium]|nr:hypothetical protein [Chloroflexota bacterium]
MYDSSPQNTPVPSFLRLVTIVESIVVGVTASVLFLLPSLGNVLWAWAIPPFNSRYTGAIYFAALLPLVVFAISGRWSPGRVVLWMIFAFTTSIGIVMLFYIPSFAWDRPGTYAFWFLYIFLPLNSAFFIYRLRDLKVAGGDNTLATLRTLLLEITIVLGLYGFGLLIMPEALTAFWPWRIDAFHGRIYAATFITPAVGAWLIHKQSTISERLVLGLTLLTLGVLSLIGVIWTSATVPAANQIDYSNLGTWVFFGMNIVTGLAGFGLISSTRKKL